MNFPNPTKRQLEILRQQHQLILNSVGEGVYGLDINGNVTFVNPAAAEMIGWDMADLIGQSMHAVLHHSHSDGTHYPRETCPIYAAFKDGAIRRVTDEVFWRKDGSSFPVEYISTPMRDEQGGLVGAVVTFRDITERKWAETVLHQANDALELKVQARTAELFQANQKLQELSDRRSRFVSMVCHEFRNPLNNIALSVSSLQRYEKQLAIAQKQDYLESIAVNINRMSSMLDDILTIGRIEAKGLSPTPQPINLVSYCQELLVELRETTHRTFQFNCRHSKLMVALDDQLLRSILINLLDNAISYSPERSEIQLKLSRRKQIVTFQVTDRGLGIPDAEKPLLFEPFHRGRNVSNIPGTGLGLSIVKQFVELLKGTIAVNSTLGVGTTFIVRIPLSET